MWTHAPGPERDPEQGRMAAQALGYLWQRVAGKGPEGVDPARHPSSPKLLSPSQPTAQPHLLGLPPLNPSVLQAHRAGACLRAPACRFPCPTRLPGPSLPQVTALHPLTPPILSVAPLQDALQDHLSSLAMSPGASLTNLCSCISAFFQHCCNHKTITPSEGASGLYLYPAIPGPATCSTW